jgi:hypothetical protein
MVSKRTGSTRSLTVRKIFSSWDKLAHSFYFKPVKEFNACKKVNEASGLELKV